MKKLISLISGALLALALVSCETGASIAPITKTLQVADAQSAYTKAVQTIAQMGGQITSQDRASGTVSAIVHGAVIMNVTVSSGTLTVTGSVMPNKVVSGQFTEVDDFIAAFSAQKP